MSATENRNEELERLQAKLTPERIRSTLAFAGLYQLTHEMLKRSVLNQVKSFFGYVDLEHTGTWIGGATAERQYKSTVLAKAPGSPFKASLLWLKDMKAIDASQVDRLDHIYAHRHELTHDLITYVADVDREPDAELFFDALKILSDISRFWVQVEKDIGTFEQFGDIDIDEVVPASIAVLDLCIRAYSDGLHVPSARPEPDEAE